MELIATGGVGAYNWSRISVCHKKTQEHLSLILERGEGIDLYARGGGLSLGVSGILARTLPKCLKLYH